MIFNSETTMSEFLHIVMMVDTGLIVYCDKDPIIANFISSGILNSVIKSLEFDESEYDSSNKIFSMLSNDDMKALLKNDSSKNFRYINFTLTRPGQINRSEVDECQTFKEEKEKAKIRAHYIRQIKNKLHNHLIKTREYDPGEIHQVIIYELQKCNPSEDFYSPAIIEYASLYQVPNEVAYQELLMKIESVNMVKIRNKALFDKYSLKISKLKNAEEGEQCFKEFVNDLWRKAAV